MVNYNNYTCYCQGGQYPGCGNGARGGSIGNNFTGVLFAGVTGLSGYIRTDSAAYTTILGRGKDAATGWNCSTTATANYSCTCEGIGSPLTCSGTSGNPGDVRSATSSQLSQYLTTPANLSKFVTTTCLP
jgi:hypothetical protein